MKAVIQWVAVLALGAGCASQPKATPSVAVTTVTATLSVSERSTGALAFDPSIANGTQPIDVDRDARGNAAYVGVEGSTTTYFDTFTDDRNSGDQSNSVDRQSYSEKVGDVRR